MTGNAWTIFGKSDKVRNTRYIVIGPQQEEQEVRDHMKADQAHFVISSVHRGILKEPPNATSPAGTDSPSGDAA